VQPSECWFAVLGQNVFFTKIIQKRFHYPPETIATKSKPECAAECEQNILPMIVAVAANVCSNNAAPNTKNQNE